MYKIACSIVFAVCLFGTALQAGETLAALQRQLDEAKQQLKGIQNDKTIAPKNITKIREAAQTDDAAKIRKAIDDFQAEVVKPWGRDSADALRDVLTEHLDTLDMDGSVGEFVQNMPKLRDELVARKEARIKELEEEMQSFEARRRQEAAAARERAAAAKKQQGQPGGGAGNLSTGGSQESTGPAMGREAQAAFIKAVRVLFSQDEYVEDKTLTSAQANKAYTDWQNKKRADFEKTVGSRKVDNWVGYVEDVKNIRGNTRTGVQVVFAVEIILTDDMKLHTVMNTHIEEASSLGNFLQTLNKGDEVAFSGEFLPSPTGGRGGVSGLYIHIDVEERPREQGLGYNIPFNFTSMAKRR